MSNTPQLWFEVQHGVVNNYYPLTRKQIGDILNFCFYNRHDTRWASRGIRRLEQGIVGNIHPAPVGGEICEKRQKINKIFCKPWSEYDHNGGFKKLANKIYEIQNSQKD